MSIKKYETFLKTVDSGSLTKASEELGYTQSAISQIISGLEDEFDLKLLIRDRSGVRLTETGHRLVPSMRAVCEANQEVQRLVANLHGMEFGCVRIGCLSGAASLLLSSLLASFSMQHPDIRFELHQGSSVKLERLLCESRLDCALITTCGNTQALETIEVLDETLLAFFPPNSEVNPAPFPLEQLAEERWILQSETALQELHGLLKQNACKAKIVCSGKDDADVLAMVSAGLGMSILPACLAGSAAVQTRPCEPPLHRSILLAYKDKKLLSPAARQFVRSVCSFGTP